MVAFIDLFFSSGVHLAMTGAISAAATVAALANESDVGIPENGGT